jgi:hypothetical protein
MARWNGRWIGPLLIGALGCSQDLRCYTGAIEVNGVCECPTGTRYVMASDACQLPDRGAPGGELSSDAAAALDAQPGAADASALDGGRGADPASEHDATIAADSAAAPASCTPPRLACGGVCVDPMTDAHCGGCASCAQGDFCQSGICVAMGCSDGTREAFADPTRFPTIAGCAATWLSSSMRALRQLALCGNSVGPCNVPSDACSDGWHVCGNVLSGPLDVTGRVTQQDCDQQPGAFAMALGDQTCTPCSEDGNGAACCGVDCVQQQGSCLWPAATSWFGVRDGVIQHCGKADNPVPSLHIGVMCCRNGL